MVKVIRNQDDDLLKNPIKPDSIPTTEMREAASENKDDRQIRERWGRLLYWEWVENILNGNYGKGIFGDASSIRDSISKTLDRFNQQFSEYTDQDAAFDAADLARDGITQNDPSTYFGSLDRRLGISSGGRFDPGSVRLSAAEIGVRQRDVIEVLPQAAAAAGVSVEILKGMWGVESRFGRALSAGSLSSARGDWQFLSGTGNMMTRKYADEVERDFRAAGHDIPSIQGRDWRMDPKVSTHMAARYIRELADGLGVDPMDKRNAGLLYAAYNVGPGGVRQLLRLAQNDPDAVAAHRLGKLAINNSQFYVNGATASDALGNYQLAVEARLNDFNRNFGDRNVMLASASVSTRGVMAIGDSHAVGMGGRSLAQNGQNLAGFRKAVLSNIDTLPQGKTILASIGSNDVMNNRNAETYAREYISLLKELKKNGNDITVVGIPALDRSYNGHDPAVWNVRAARMNDAIEREARRNGMSYVDMDGPSSDGLHRTRDGYKATVQNAVYRTIKDNDINDNPVRVASSAPRIDPAADISAGRTASVREVGLVDRVADAGRSVIKRFASLDLNPFS